MEKKSNYDYSIAFTKVLMCFCVVLYHYWTASDLGFYPAAMMYRLREVAVPVFIIISFFLTYPIYVNKDKAKIKKRGWRLLFPYVSWAVIYFAGYSALDFGLRLCGSKSGLEMDLSWKDLLWQLALGSDRNLCPQFWYQFDLMVLTVIFWVVFRYIGKYARHIVVLIALFALFMQYSGLNFKLFGSFEYEVIFPTGRIAEVFPFAVIGFLLADFRFFDRIRSYKIITVSTCLASMLLIANMGLLTAPEGTFLYGGTQILLYGTLAFIFLHELPFDKLPGFAKKALEFLSRYSFGVFCIHFGIGYCWNTVICRHFGLEENTMVECVIIFAVSYVLSWAISLIPGKFSKQLVE